MLGELLKYVESHLTKDIFVGFLCGAFFGKLVNDNLPDMHRRQLFRAILPIMLFLYFFLKISFIPLLRNSSILLIQYFNNEQFKRYLAEALSIILALIMITNILIIGINYLNRLRKTTKSMAY